MAKYLADKEPQSYKFDQNVKECEYCLSSGGLAVPGSCPSTAVGYFANNNMPATCTQHASSLTVNRNQLDDYIEELENQKIPEDLIE